MLKNNIIFIMLHRNISIIVYSLLLVIFTLSFGFLFYQNYTLIIDDSFILKFQIGLVFVVILLFIPYSGYFIKTFNVILIIFYILFLISMYKLNILSHSTPYTTIFEIEGVFKIQRFLSQEDLLQYILIFCLHNGYNLSENAIYQFFRKDLTYEEMVQLIEAEHARELADAAYWDFYLKVILGSSILFFCVGFFTFCQHYQIDTSGMRLNINSCNVEISHTFTKKAHEIVEQLELLNEEQDTSCRSIQMEYYNWEMDLKTGSYFLDMYEDVKEKFFPDMIELNKQLYTKICLILKKGHNIDVEKIALWEQLD